MLHNKYPAIGLFQPFQLELITPLAMTFYVLLHDILWNFHFVTNDITSTQTS